MNESWNRLIAADPATGDSSPPPDLFGQIVSLPPEAAPGRGRFRRWFSRGAVTILVALLVGGAVSWAAGVDPIDQWERLWGLKRDTGLTSSSSEYGRAEFSVLEPMTGDPVEVLPERLKFWLAFARSKSTPIPPGTRPDDFTGPRLTQRPRQVAGWGEITTDGGELVSVVSMNDSICLVYDRYHGGSCEPIEKIARSGITVTASPGGGQPRTMLGLVTDEVATLRFKEPGFGDISLKDNVFDVTGLPGNRSWILGLDDDGSVVTRILVNREFDPRGHNGWMPVGPQPVRPRPAG